MFKGTTARPSSRAISEPIERIGGILNASTDKETTAYWTKMASQHLPISIDLLADMLQHSRVTPTEVAKEQAVIVEEGSPTSIDDPQEWVHNLVDEALWPGHPVGRDVGGTRESVLGLKRSGRGVFQAGYYGANNALLVVAGGLDAKQVLRLAEDHFGDWNTVDPRPFIPVAESDSHNNTVRLEERPTEQVHICLAFPGLSRSPRPICAGRARHHPGGSTTSRLFLEVRERLALAYDVHVYATRVADTGSVVVYAGVDPAWAERAVKAIQHQIDRVRRRAVSSDELTRTVDYMKGRMFLGLEDSHAVANWLGAQGLLLQKIMSPEDLAAELEAVTPQDIKRVANTVFDPDRAHLAAIGPNLDAIAREAGSGIAAFFCHFRLVWLNSP